MIAHKYQYKLPFHKIFAKTQNVDIFCSHGRKPRSNFRRPSSLGLAATPLANKTETKGSFQPKPAGRSHIVAPLKDHLKPEGGFQKSTEVKSNYRNLSPARPVCNKIKDHLKVYQPGFLYVQLLHFFRILAFHPCVDKWHRH